MQSRWIMFVETEVFTSRVARFGLDGAIRRLQLELVQDPERGALDNGTGGLRKVRIPLDRGKSSGARVHYLWLEKRRRIYLIFLYRKDEQDSLTSDQKKALKALVQRIKNEA